MYIEEVNHRLEQLPKKNVKYYNALIPGTKPVLGVAVPNLRKIAKEIAKENYEEFLSENPMDNYEQEMLQAMVIGYAKDDIDTILRHFTDFVPIVHDWSVSDALCQTFTIARKEQKAVWDCLMQYKESENPFEKRIVAIILMSHYLNDSYIDQVITVLDALPCTEYYDKMGVAWAVATVMAKYPDKCLAFMKDNHLDDWTYNKAIQKMIESYRVSDEMKTVVRGMKRGK